MDEIRHGTSCGGLGRALRQLRHQGWALIGLPASLSNAYRELEASGRQFFALSDHDKDAFNITRSAGHRGWVSRDEAGDYVDEGERCYEAFDIGRDPLPCDRTQHPLRGPNRFRNDECGEQMRAAASQVFDELSQLSQKIGDLVCEDLGVDRCSLRALRREPVSQLRLLHYLPPTTIDLRTGMCPDDRVAMGAHTDYEFFTLMYQSGPGTEFLGPDGNWHSLPTGDHLVLFAGDMLETFSAGRYTSLLHRAGAAVSPGRVSIPFFAGADFDAVVRPVTPSNASDRSEMSGEGVHFGEHLMTQLERDFPYLRRPETAGDRSDPAAAQSAFERRALQSTQSTQSTASLISIA